MSYLGLDVGTKRIGCAYAISKTSAVIPLKTIIVEKDYIQKIVNLIKEYEIESVVLGSPKHLSGKTSQSNLMVEEFKEKLLSKVEIDVFQVDERFTTKIAREKLQSINVNAKKAKGILDSLAACGILESYLNQTL